MVRDNVGHVERVSDIRDHQKRRPNTHWLDNVQNKNRKSFGDKKVASSWLRLGPLEREAGGQSSAWVIAPRENAKSDGVL